MCSAKTDTATSGKLGRAVSFSTRASSAGVGFYTTLQVYCNWFVSDFTLLLVSIYLFYKSVILVRSSPGCYGWARGNHCINWLLPGSGGRVCGLGGGLPLHDSIANSLTKSVSSSITSTSKPSPFNITNNFFYGLEIRVTKS